MSVRFNETEVNSIYACFANNSPYINVNAIVLMGSRNMATDYRITIKDQGKGIACDLSTEELIELRNKIDTALGVVATSFLTL